MRSSPFFPQAQLVIRSLPHVGTEDCFALKGGTAINLFLRDIPRLSVDIDLTYVPIEPREPSLEHISQALSRIARRIERGIGGASVVEAHPKGSSHVARLFVETPDARIVIEPNHVIRGTVFPTEDRDLVEEAEHLFEMAVSVPTLSSADLYGGKICAALDRQHPRDLFDIKLLLGAEGITDSIRRAFIVYLASHNRPISELLAPGRHEFRQVFENELVGMVRYSVSYDELVDARDRLVETLRECLTDAEREFLISLKSGDPDWTLLGIPEIERLPAIQWKLANIRKMDTKKRTDALAHLKAVLAR